MADVYDFKEIRERMHAPSQYKRPFLYAIATHIAVAMLFGFSASEPSAPPRPKTITIALAEEQTPAEKPKERKKANTHHADFNPDAKLADDNVTKEKQNTSYNKKTEEKDKPDTEKTNPALTDRKKSTDSAKSIDDVVEGDEKSAEDQPGDLDAEKKSSAKQSYTLADILNGKGDIKEYYRNNYKEGDRNSVTYDELFRTYFQASLHAYHIKLWDEDFSSWLDVDELLTHNRIRGIKIIAKETVVISESGDVVLKDLTMNPKYYDPDDIIKKFFERFYKQCPTKFVPPSEAGLKPPHEMKSEWGHGD